MRAIFRKLDRRLALTDGEYQQLMDYIEQMGRKSAPSYSLFYQQYAGILEDRYNTVLPRFWYGLDDVLNYLLGNQDKLDLAGQPSWELFPPYLQPYIKYTFHHGDEKQHLLRWTKWLQEKGEDRLVLPRPRSGQAVCVYEEGNPYKEPGLKVHFERLSRYTFVTRLQSYRYLTRNKVPRDRIEVLAPDRLGGTFTNKDKSLYYFIYLTEEDPVKAENACQVLNFVLEGLRR
ncbi:MAG: hypothetical protein ABFD04_05500 [Syntrophomonas sp.]